MKLTLLKHDPSMPAKIGLDEYISRQNGHRTWREYRRAFCAEYRPNVDPWQWGEPIEFVKYDFAEGSIIFDLDCNAVKHDFRFAPKDYRPARRLRALHAQTIINPSEETK